MAIIIGAILGFIITGDVFGALLGGAIGGLKDLFWISPRHQEDNRHRKRQYSRQTYTDGYAGTSNPDLITVLMTLSAYIIRIDGRIMHSEMETVRNFLRQNFGEATKTRGEQILLSIFQRQKRMDDRVFTHMVMSQARLIQLGMSYAERIQILYFLGMIIQADGEVNVQEINALRQIAIWIGVAVSEVDTILNLKKNDLDSAYKVLGISPNASNDEVKAAYRKLVLMHHPDKVAKLGEDAQKAAENKLREINAAKERICTQRGL